MIDLSAPEWVADAPPKQKSDANLHPEINDSAADEADFWDEVQRALKVQTSQQHAEPGTLSADLRLDITNPKAVEWMQKSAGDLVVQITDEQRAIIKQTMVDAFEQGITPAAVARRLRSVIGLTSQQAGYVNGYRNQLELQNIKPDMVDKLVEKYRQRWLRHRSETIARTETIRASNKGNQLLWQQAVDGGYIDQAKMERVWIVTPDDRLCPKCRPYRGLRAPIGGTFEGGFEGPPLHPRCLPAGTAVLAEEIRAGSDRWYEGDMILIHTAGGKQLSCTPNHPILTGRGWVSAEALQIGEQIICVEDSTHKTDNQNMPTSIEQIIESLSMGSIITEVPTSAPDFHGDGVGSKVAVIYSNSLLGNMLDTERVQNVRNELLVGVELPMALYRQSMIGLFGNGVDLVTSCFMCSEYLRVPSLRCHLRPLEQFSFRPTSNNNFTKIENSTDYITTGSVMGGSRLFRDSVGVHLNDILINDPEFFVQRFAPSSSSRSTSLLRINDAEPSSFSKGFDSLGPTSTDTVDSLSRKWFSGHVYNLETESGWYIAEGIITHNCRCTQGLVEVGKDRKAPPVPPPWAGPGGTPMKPSIPKSALPKIPPKAFGPRVDKILAAPVGDAGIADERIARAAYDGEHAGLTTKVSKVTPVLGGSEIDGIISAGTQQVGQFSRHVSPDGKAITNDMLSLDGVSPAGFTREFDRNAEDVYIANGVQTIQIEAENEGGYAYARQGYDFASPADLKSVKQYVLARLAQLTHNSTSPWYGLSTEGLIQRITVAKHTWDLAGLMTDDGRLIGRDLMTGSHWQGIKQLQPDAPTYQAGELAYRSMTDEPQQFSTDGLAEWLYEPMADAIAFWSALRLLLGSK